MQETGRQVRGRGSAKTSNEFPLEIRKLPRGVEFRGLFFYSRYTISFLWGIYRRASSLFVFTRPPLSLSLSHTSPQIPPENCITRRSVGERDNISHARPRYTTKFLAEIYKGRRPGINLARSRNTGKETSLLNVRLPSRIMLTTDFTTLFLSFYFPFFFPLCIKLVNCEHLTMFFLRVFSFLSVYTFRIYIYIYIHFLVEIRLVPLFLPASRLESRLLDFSRYSQAWMGRRCNGVFYNRDALMTLSLRLIFR